MQGPEEPKIKDYLCKRDKSDPLLVTEIFLISVEGGDFLLTCRYEQYRSGKRPLTVVGEFRPYEESDRAGT